MGGTKIAGFPHKSYKTLQAVPRKIPTFQNKINGMGFVQSEPGSLFEVFLKIAMALL
jgi:hypothetical protein